MVFCCIASYGVIVKQELQRKVEFKSIQRFVHHLWHFLKMAKIWRFALKVLFSTISARIFNSKMFVYTPYSIYDYIKANLNFQKIM